MKLSEYKSYDDLPLFLNAELVAKVLGVSPSSGYELMHENGFPVLRVPEHLGTVVIATHLLLWEVEAHVLVLLTLLATKSLEPLVILAVYKMTTLTSVRAI